MTGLVSLSQAMKELQFQGDAQGRKLFRHLCKRERELKAKLVEETSGGQKRVSVTKLKVLCPELRPHGERAVLRVAESKHNETIRGEVFRHYDEQTAPQLRKLLADYRRILERVSELEEQVTALKSCGRENSHQKK